MTKKKKAEKDESHSICLVYKCKKYGEIKKDCNFFDYSPFNYRRQIDSCVKRRGKVLGSLGRIVL